MVNKILILKDLTDKADQVLVLVNLSNQEDLDELSRNAGFDSWAHVLDYADSCGGACAIDLINPYIYRYDIEGLLQQAIAHPEDTPLIAQAYQAHLEHMAQEEQKSEREEIKAKRLMDAYMRAKDADAQEDMKNVQEALKQMREEMERERAIRDYFDKYGKRG